MPRSRTVQPYAADRLCLRREHRQLVCSSVWCPDRRQHLEYLKSNNLTQNFRFTRTPIPSAHHRTRRAKQRVEMSKRVRLPNEK
jgi:hypothetical protein